MSTPDIVETATHWCVDHDEYLHDSIADAIDAAVAGDDPDEMVVVHGYVLDPIPAGFGREVALNDLVDMLDCTYAPNDGSGLTDLTAAMQAAEDAFRAAVFAEYPYRPSRRVETRTERVGDYIDTEATP